MKTFPVVVLILMVEYQSLHHCIYFQPKKTETKKVMYVIICMVHILPQLEKHFDFTIQHGL